MRAAIIILLLLIANALFGAATPTHSGSVVAAARTSLETAAAPDRGAASRIHHL